MTITLHLAAEQERRLEEGRAQQDTSVVRQVLHQAVDAMVPQLLSEPAEQLDVAAFESLLDSIAEEAPSAQGLSEEAVSRAGIYSEHP